MLRASAITTEERSAGGDRLSWPLRKLRATILLAGSVRASPLRRATDRFILELPIDRHRCVMDGWHAHLRSLARRLERDSFPVRVIVDRSTSTPQANRWNRTCEVSFEQDPFEFRGTGGLLGDLARQYEDDDYLLIANAPQVLYEPLTMLAESMGRLEADIVLACQPDGSPAGIMLVRCGCLRAIPRVGFIDLSEQALPMIAQSHDVRVWKHPHPTGHPIRTLSGYLEAVREYHRRLSGRADIGDPMAEDWNVTFDIVEDGAQVDPTAVVHDSIVLRGAKVGYGAVLVRAVVCPGAHVIARQSAIDRLVSAPASLVKRGAL